MAGYQQDNAGSVRGLVLRATRLDINGNPVVSGSCDTYITTGFIKLTFTPEYTTGNEVEVDNASGAVCVYYKMPDTLKDVKVNLELCDPDPVLTQILSGGVVLTASQGPNTQAVGYAAEKLGIDATPYGCALEVWANAILGGKTAPGLPYWHYVFPFLKLALNGDRVVENGALATVFEGTGVGNANFGAGPNMDTAGIAPPVTSSAFAFGFPAYADRSYAYERSANAPVGLQGCFANLTPVPATGATAGTPGTFTPPGAVAPANLAATAGVTASPTSAWTTGQYVLLGDASNAHWTSSAWAAGKA